MINFSAHCNKKIRRFEKATKSKNGHNNRKEGLKYKTIELVLYGY
jgi:hypothetical protein